MDFQVMPPLSGGEYEELKKDISERGVMVPIEYDEDGNVLDGHHRIKACQELGITVWPRLIRKGFTDEQKRTHARMLNLARRHLTQEQRRDLIKEQLKETPALSDRQIARGLGVDHKTVSAQRAEAVESGEIPHFSKRVDPRTGKQSQPATKPKPRTVFVSTEVAQKAGALPEKHKEAVLSGNKKPMEAFREAKIEEIAKIVDLPDAKYRVIYADPPWSYGNTQPDYHTEQRDHYPVMPLSELCSMPVNDMCEDDAVLFLWVTSPILEESFQVIRSWGFKYKASFVWDKVKHNMGHYNSVRHEFLLICTKGSCQPDVRKLFDSVITEERTEHSKKPEVVYDIIDKLYPYGKRVELFSRQKRSGWDAYGYQADNA